MKVLNKGPTARDLEKKHKLKNIYVGIIHKKGDVVDNLLNNLKETLGGTKSSILRNALFSYNLFIQQSIKEGASLTSKEKVE